MEQSTQRTYHKNIVVVGGSYCGVSVAHYLLKHTIPILPEEGTYQIVLVSTSSEVICRPACPRAMISDEMFPQDKLFVSIPDQFKQHSEGAFRFIQATATGLDHTNRNLAIRLKAGTTEKIDFYALVVATGASTFSPLLGLNQDEDFLRKIWAEFREALPTAKSIIIGGGGPAGVETAGELGEYLNGVPGWFSSKLVNPKVSITIVTSGSDILPVLRPAIAQKAENCLTKVGVAVIKNARIQTVSPERAGKEENLTSKTKVTLDDGTVLDADLYIPAFGTQPNTNFIDKSLLAADGRIETNPTTLRVDKAGERIYSVGDVASYARPAIHNILEAIPVLCANIKRDLLLAAGQEHASVHAERNFKEDTRETQLVPMGKNQAVGAAMGWQLPAFLVWLIKGRDYWLWTTGNLWSGKQWAKES